MIFMEWWIKLILIFGISFIYYLLSGSGDLALFMVIVLAYFSLIQKKRDRNIYK